jgi:hypothetical protein
MSTTWNPITHTDYDTLKGYDVYSSDNEKLGTIKEVLHPQMDMPAARGNHSFRVEPGMMKKLFGDRDEVFVSESLIRTVNPGDEKVVLSVAKDRLLNETWERPKNFDSFRRS